MKAKVTEQGVIIPKSLLPDVDEVDIRRRNGVIEVAPVGENGNFPSRELEHTPPARNDKGIGEIGPYPLIELARNPVYDPEITDGSVNHDKYIYGL